MICENYGLIAIMYVISKFMDILYILGPILALVSLGLSLVKLVTNPEEKKNKSRIKNCLIALVVVFFLPVIVNATMNLVTDGYSVEGCFEIAKNHENILDPTTYTDMPSDGRKKSSILIDPNAYDKVEKPGSSNGVSYPEGDSDVDRNELLVVADRLWKQVYNGGFTYSSSSTKKIPISMSKKIIDCSSYVTWILYEAGYTQFGGYQLKTRDFMVFDWTSLGATVIDVKAGENVVSKLEPGDILVRTPVSKSGNPGYGHVNITAYVKDNRVYSYDCGSTNNWKRSNGKPTDKTGFAKDNRPGKIIRFK